MKIFERIKRIPTWEECRERCNNHAECEHFRFKVGEISVLIVTVDRLVCPGSPEHEAQVVLPHEDRSQVQERLGLWGQVLLHAR